MALAAFFFFFVIFVALSHAQLWSNGDAVAS